MTEADKIAMVKILCDEKDDDVISAYLLKAGKTICGLVYPYKPDVTEVPAQYEMTQIDAAVYWLNKRGAEGEIAHSANGVSITYEDADLPPSMLRGVVPFCGVV